MTRTAGTRPGPQARRAAAGRGAPRYVTIVHSDIVASTELVAAAGPGYPQRSATAGPSRRPSAGSAGAPCPRRRRHP